MAKPRKVERRADKVQADFFAKGIPIHREFALMAAKEYYALPLRERIEFELKNRIKRIKQILTEPGTLKEEIEKKKAENRIRRERKLREKFKELGYEDEIVDALIRLPKGKRDKVLEELKVKSITPPNIAFRIMKTEHADLAMKEGLKPREFPYLSVKTPKTIFILASPGIAENFLDKKAKKRFEKGYKEFVKDRSKIREQKDKGVKNITKDVSAMASTYESVMGALKAKKVLEKVGTEESQIAWLTAYSKLMKQGEIENKPKMSVLLIDLEKLIEHHKKNGKNVVLVEDPELKGSYMIFEKTKKGLKPIDVPPQALKKVDLGRVSYGESRDIQKKVEDAYIKELVKAIEKEEIMNAAREEKKHGRKRKNKTTGQVQNNTERITTSKD